MSDDNEEVPSLAEDRKQRYRDQHKGAPLVDLIREMNTLRSEKDEAEMQMKELNAEYDVLRLELIPAKMEEAGIENLRVEGIGRVSLTGDMYVKELDKEGFYDWLHHNNLGSLIKETIMSSTLKAFVKGRVKAGKEIPEGLVKITPFTRASITKA